MQRLLAQIREIENTRKAIEASLVTKRAENALLHRAAINSLNGTTTNLLKSNFTQKNVPGNGSCFYHAILVSAFGISPSRGGPNVRDLRTGVKRYLTEFYNNMANNAVVATSKLGSPISKRQFLNQLNNMGCFAGQAEIMAAAHVLGRRIIVLYNSGRNTYGIHPTLTYRAGGLPASNPIYVWYNASPNRSGSHFQSLIRKNSQSLH
jgi:hypothetical protein